MKLSYSLAKADSYVTYAIEMLVELIPTLHSKVRIRLRSSVVVTPRARNIQVFDLPISAIGQGNDVFNGCSFKVHQSKTKATRFEQLFLKQLSFNRFLFLGADS